LHGAAFVRYWRLAVPLAVAALASGCTGIELPALGAAALSAGLGNAVRAGTEYTLTGTAYRTFSLPLDDLAGVVRQTLDRMDFPIAEEKLEDGRLTIDAEGIHRALHLTFTPISRSVTRLGVSVKQGLILRDRSTASELITQIQESLLTLKSARR